MKYVIKYATFILAFVLSTIVCLQFMNKGNTEMTVEMNNPTIPYMNILYEGQVLNHMLGNYEQMDVAYERDSITPMGEDRLITLQIHNANQGIESIQYEVRTLEGERLIEQSQVMEYDTSKGIITCELILKDLIESEQEYSLTIELTQRSGLPLYYYTRIIQTTKMYPSEKIDFAREFHETTLEKENASQIAMYMETDARGDNTSYYNVNIHSSLDQVMWGDLEVVEVGTPLVTLKELGVNTAVIGVDSLYEIAGEQKIFQCKVTEYFRVSRGAQRMYLLNYERKAEEVINLEDFQLINNKIVVGITDPEFTTVESEGGNIIAFVTAGGLYTYNLVENKFSCLFNYYDQSEMDIRNYTKENDITILSVEETGNVRFLVSGYKARGSREGYVGVQIYYYDSKLNTIEVELYIPYTKSDELLKENVAQLSYMSRDNRLYLMIDNALHEVDLNTLTYEVIASGLGEGEFYVSDSNEMIVWHVDGLGELPGELMLMDLVTREQISIQAPYTNYIKALGFVGNDLIYGLIDERDVVIDDMGQAQYPMYVVSIRNQQGDIVKEYKEVDTFIMDCTISANHILVERVQKVYDDEEKISFHYAHIEEDQILNNAIQNYKMNEIEMIVTTEYKKIAQLVLKSIVGDRKVMVTVPGIVLYEGEHIVDLGNTTEDTPKYYVYAQNGIEQISYKVADAVQLAKEYEGIVVNQQGKLVWEPGNLLVRNQIMSITSGVRNQELSSLATVLDVILEYEGIAQTTQNQINQGKDAIEILEYSLIEHTILDLRGCELEDMRFYLNRDIPILVLLKEGEAMLLTGFNSNEVVIYNGNTGKLEKKSMASMRRLFEENGNHFIGYLSNKIEG